MSKLWLRSAPDEFARRSCVQYKLGAAGRRCRRRTAPARLMRQEGTATVWRGVYAVVYTYNRKELVLQCLAALSRQTVRPEHVVLVDNGCTDGTRDFLARHGVFEDPTVDYLRLEQNTGAAGGLRAGIARAFHRGCEWAWVMDDDVVCEPDGLEQLKRAYEENFGSTTRLGFLVSQLVGSDGRANNVPQVDDRIECSDRCAEWAEFLAQGLVRVRISTLTSILLPRTTLAAFGTPSPDFFIWGEDTDYTLRITSRLPGYLVGRSRAVHLRGVGGFLDIFNERDVRRLHNFYYLYRNTTYLRRTFWPTHGFVLFLGKAALHFCRALGERDHRLLRARLILFGTLAGLFFEPRPSPLAEPEPSASSCASRQGLAPPSAADAGWPQPG